MHGSYEPPPARSRPGVDAGRLWAGGLATAVVAALIAVVGVVIGRNIFDITVLPTGPGSQRAVLWYAGGAALASLAATALVHLLMLSTPRPMRFFGWVMALATTIAVLVPLMAAAGLGTRLFLALLDLVLGLAIGTLVAGTARSAVRPVRRGDPYQRPDVVL